MGLIPGTQEQGGAPPQWGSHDAFSGHTGPKIPVLLSFWRKRQKDHLSSEVFFFCQRSNVLEYYMLSFDTDKVKTEKLDCTTGHSTWCQVSRCAICWFCFPHRWWAKDHLCRQWKALLLWHLSEGCLEEVTQHLFTECENGSIKRWLSVQILSLQSPESIWHQFMS